MQDDNTNTTPILTTRFDPNDLAAKLICADGRIWDEFDFHGAGKALALADARAAHNDAAEYSRELKDLATKHPTKGIGLYLAIARTTRNDARRNLAVIAEELA